MEVVLRPIFSVLTVPELKIKRNVDVINNASDPVEPKSLQLSFFLLNLLLQHSFEDPEFWPAGSGYYRPVTEAKHLNQNQQNQVFAKHFICNSLSK